MTWGPLTLCQCGHVANHHGDVQGCHVAGCPCRRFTVASDQTVTLEEHNATIDRANRTIRRLKADLAEARKAAK